MIASNISAEQFIGMSGSGFKVGVAVAAYEWVAAIVLIIVAVFYPTGLIGWVRTFKQRRAARASAVQQDAAHAATQVAGAPVKPVQAARHQPAGEAS